MSEPLYGPGDLLRVTGMGNYEGLLFRVGKDGVNKYADRIYYTGTVSQKYPGKYSGQLLGADIQFEKGDDFDGGAWEEQCERVGGPEPCCTQKKPHESMPKYLNPKSEHWIKGVRPGSTIKIGILEEEGATT